jgi:hypothetical protein
MPGLLETTKRSADIHDVVAIHPNSASPQPTCNRARLLDVMGPDSGHQAIGGLICPTDHLVDILKGMTLMTEPKISSLAS